MRNLEAAAFANLFHRSFHKLLLGIIRQKHHSIDRIIKRSIEAAVLKKFYDLSDDRQEPMDSNWK